MSRSLPRTIAILFGVMTFWTTRAYAEIKIVRPEPDNLHRLAVVSDGASPWILRYYGTVATGKTPFTPYVASNLVPVSADRMLFTHGLVLHLIDTRNGIVLRRWIFSDAIKAVRVEGEKFHVTTFNDEDPLTGETITITTDSPPPARWLDRLTYQRGAVYEGSWFSKVAGLESGYSAKGPLQRKPLAPEDAERLIPEVEDAIRRDPFSPQHGVCLALLMRDLGRKDAEVVFQRAIQSPTNSYGELFMIANELGDGGETEWSTAAFDQAYARLWQQGADPRLIHGLLPRLILLYLPYELRTEIADARRNQLLERLYLLGPYVEQAPPSWKQLAAYFDARGDAQSAELWRARAVEAQRKSGYVWELAFYVEHSTRVLVALFICIPIYWVVLQRRYAPQRRLHRAGKSWWHGLLRLSPLSMTCWDRRDRQILFGLLALFWLAAGLWGGLGQGALRSYKWPIAGASGTLRAPVVEKFLRDLSPTRDRDLLLAVSLQQAEKDTQAEALYLTLPDSVVKWNNLGVLQAKQGKTDQASQSFERALSLDSQAIESTFNLDRPVSDLWADMHSKYLPGRKMLALPAHDVFYRTVRGSIWSLAGQSLRGPILGVPTYRKALDEVFSFSGRTPPSIPGKILYLFLFGPLILGAIALLSPYREVTQPPERSHGLTTLVFPGTGREWGRAGGLVLVTVIWGALEYLFINRQWTPFESFVNYRMAFGLPLSIRGLVTTMDPGWFWNHGIVILAVVVFGANAILVIAGEWRQRRTTT